MKNLILAVFSLFFGLTVMAEEPVDEKDTTIFVGYLYNAKYDVYIQMDFYHQNILVPHQEVFGEVAGFLGDKQDARKWIFTNVELKDNTTAGLQITNDYGSEDLTATLRQVNDSTFELRQEQGSTIKIVRNRKWLKVPKTLVMVRK